MRFVATAMLLCALATHARAEPTVDTVLAQDLRDAFGAQISHCTASDCNTDLGTVWCDDTACRVIDHLDHERSVVATGQRARQFARRLHAIGSDLFDTGWLAAWHVKCHSLPSNATHGLCDVELKLHDVELADRLTRVGFASSKLGGFRWSGRTVVRCDDPADLRACTVDCAPDVVHDPDAAGFDLFATCASSKQSLPVSELLFARARARSAMVDCQTWRTIDGLTNVTGCGVVARR